MSATNAFETSLLSHIFENAAAANVGDTTGLQGSQVAGSFWISLHTATLGETSAQNTTEASYTGGYARVSVARSTAGWTASGNTVDNDAAITFATSTNSQTVTDFGIGSASSGAGNLFFYGALTSPLSIANGITPEFAIGALDITLD